MREHQALFFRNVLTIAVLLTAATPIAAQEEPPVENAAAETPSSAEEAKSPTSQPMALQSLIPTLPDYSGGLWKRSFLTGDWGGERTKLAEQGILFDLTVTQNGQGNAHGGKNTNGAFEYGGAADYTLRLDTARMGLWPGGLLTLHGETQMGRSTNGNVGSLAPSNFKSLLPFPGDPGITTLSEFYITQALSEKLVLIAGKIDPMAGDRNVFAGDASHTTQFMNTAFNVNPVLFPAAPYTTMAAGMILLPTEWLTISTLVTDNDPNGAARTTGFNTAFHGRNWMSITQEYDIKVKLFGKPGNQRFGWFYTNRDFIDFAGDSRLPMPGRTQRVGLLPRGLGPLKFPKLPRSLRSIRVGNTVFSTDEPNERPDDWGVFYNFDQYLYTEANDPTQGFGLFGRFSWSTGESNPIEEFYSIGLGGKGSIPNRDRDTWGLGYYLINISDDLPKMLGMDAEQGTELFYNIEVTPWLHITPNLQVIVDPGAGFQDRDVAIAYGLRAQVSF
jgi:porin